MQKKHTLWSGLVLGALTGLTAGCRDDSVPPPTADTPDAAATTGAVSPRPEARRARPVTRLHPHVMKAYRADVCYFGSLTLEHTKNAYLASLGGKEPAADNLPDFGEPEPPEPRQPSATEAPKEPTSASRERAAAARRAHAMRIPHERNARSCSVAAGLKEPAAPGVDEALARYSEFAVDLAQTLTKATVYYERKQYESDDFKQGKEYHAKLTAGFEKLGEHRKQLGEALVKWRTESPPPADPVQRPEGAEEPEPPDEAQKERERVNDEGRALANAAYDTAYDIMLGMFGPTPDAESVKKGLDDLATKTEALKKFGDDNAIDTWSKMLVRPLENFQSAVEKAAGANKLDSDEELFELVNVTSQLIEARHRAVTRSLITRRKGVGLKPPRMRPQIPIPSPKPEGPAAPEPAAPKPE